MPETLLPGKFYIKVPDTLLALKDLAAWYRAQFSIPFVQVTGSVGKTTTKEMIASVLDVKFNKLKTAANYNNEIGTPQTLLGLSHAHQAAVIETGMDRAGQIRYLGEMVKPDIAVITNVGDMHIEYLGSRENILKAKCEIFENLKKDGLAVLNGDDELLNTVSLPQKTLRCGLSEHCDVRVSEVEDLGIDGIRCVVTTAKERYALSIPVPGKHMVYSAAMAAAIGEYLGETKEEIERGAAAYEPAGSRMHVITFSENRRLLDDCYNAGPQSMAASLRVLGASGGKKAAVIGDMAELGELTERAHKEIGELTKELGIDTVMRSGFLMPLMERHAASEFFLGDFAVTAARTYKDAAEQELMRVSSAANDAVMADAIKLVHEGVTEREIADQMLGLYRKHGCEGFSFPPIVSFGANAGDPHHEPNGTVLKRGDVVLFDIGGRHRNYCSDMTRTFFWGEPDEETAHIYDIVRRANEAAEALIAPGVRMCDLDRAARDVIEDAGYGKYFTHRLGHSIGLQDHEPGDVSLVNEQVVEPGMTFSIEPGIYLPGRTGVRIEDLALVTENGVEILNAYPHDAMRLD